MYFGNVEKMNKINTKWKRHTAIALLVILFSSNVFVSRTFSQTNRPRVIIKDDGTITPPEAPIRRNGDIYTFTGNIYAEISIQKSNIVLDGAGYTLHGPYNGTNESAFIIGEGPDQVPSDVKVPYSIGIDLAFPSIGNFTIQNLNIRNFSIGMYIWTTNNIVTGNAITDNIVGILLSGANNRITWNCIGRNTQGVFFGWSNEIDGIPEGIEISHNSFESNGKHLSGCLCQEFNLTENVHTWDDGSEGNYWDDYSGTDTNNDGIGDTLYAIDVLNIDRYPLMESSIVMPTVEQAMPVEFIIAGLAAALVVATTFFIALLKRRKIAQDRRME